jgi:hypothetical protein
MKMSIVEVRDMLSALSAQEVEKPIGKLWGVKSVTVNSLREAPQCATPKPGK